MTTEKQLPERIAVVTDCRASIWRGGESPLILLECEYIRATLPTLSKEMLEILPRDTQTFVLAPGQALELIQELTKPLAPILQPEIYS